MYKSDKGYREFHKCKQRIKEDHERFEVFVLQNAKNMTILCSDNNEMLHIVI
jgi:hypothetical protein